MRSALHMGCRRIGTAGAGSWMVGMGTAGASAVALPVSVAYGLRMGIWEALAVTAWFHAVGTKAGLAVTGYAR